MTKNKDATGAEKRNSLEINYERAATETINKVRQDLATKEIEQRLKQEKEKQRLNETLCMTRPKPETRENSMSRGSCNTLKVMTGKPFGITKIGAKIMSIITVGGHEVTRNLSEQSDQTISAGERNLCMSFLLVENLDESDQFILCKNLIRNFDVTIDLNNAMFKIRNPERKYVIKPINLIMANKNKAPVFLSRRVRLKKMRRQ